MDYVIRADSCRNRHTRSKLTLSSSVSYPLLEKVSRKHVFPSKARTAVVRIPVHCCTTPKYTKIRTRSENHCSLTPLLVRTRRIVVVLLALQSSTSTHILVPDTDTLYNGAVSNIATRRGIYDTQYVSSVAIPKVSIHAN